jgi:uncharacterized membrane protein YiaA
MKNIKTFVKKNSIEFIFGISFITACTLLAIAVINVELDKSHIALALPFGIAIFISLLTGAMLLLKHTEIIN